MNPRIKRNFRLAALSTTLLFPFSMAQANLLVNGSFETGTFTGWTVAGAATVGGGQGTTDGTRAATFNGANVVGSMVLSQTVATTPGQLYRLQFDHGVFGAAQTQNLGVNVAGAGSLLNTSVADLGTNPTTYLRRYFDLTANSATTTVTFTDQATAAQSNSADGNLDNVIFALTPALVLSPGGSGNVGVVNYVSGNVALSANGSVATQNTTSSGGLAPRGNDGNTNGSYGAGSVTHTAGAVGDFWRVDLNDEYAISHINVFNRTDCCGARLMEFNINVINDELGSTQLNPFDLGTPGNGTGGVPSAGLRFDLAPNTIADAVSIVQNAAFPLSLAEVQAVGLANLIMNPIDILLMDVGPAGTSDFFNVQGTASLQGILALSSVGGYFPDNDDFILLSASSINLGNLAISHSFGPGVLSSLSVVAGGNGQNLVLNLQFIPEPATATLGIMGMAGLLLRRRRMA